MTMSMMRPGDHTRITEPPSLLRIDVRWNAGAQTAFAERVTIAALPLARGRLQSREHLVFDNQPTTPEGSVRLGAQAGIVEVVLPHVPAEVERISVVAYIRPRPNAPRRTLDQLDELSFSVRHGVNQAELGRTQNLAGRLGPVGGAAIAEIVREDEGWTVIAQATGHESGLEGAAATAGVRL